MESANPRREGCPCGRPRDEHIAPRVLPRNIRDEQELTYEAARGPCGVDPTPLIEFSEVRAGEDHGYVAPHLLRIGVDWLREGRCELADLRNYLCWWLQANQGDPKSHDVFTALGYVCLIYDLLIREADD